MTLTSVIALGLALAALRGAVAQTFQSEVNVSMCNWRQLRANIIRDTIYLDGGSLYWLYGLSDGTTYPQPDDGSSAVLFSLNLSYPFDTKTSNLTAQFNRTSKTGGSAANNIAPNYLDGAMLANDFKFFLYGGLLRLTDSQSSPHADDVLSYERYQWGPPRTSWQPGFIQESLKPVTRYITHGAAASVPSENLAFYFSGKRGQDWGDIENPTPRANVTANTLISVDMSTMREEKWTNATLPDDIPGRANAELVWIPVAQSGVLVAIGGVVNPEDIFGGPGLSTAQVQENNSTGPGFMQSLPVYDIAGEKWYMQNTTGDFPPQLSQFCSVMATAKDRSSFNIYIYGGYDGTTTAQRASDDVYILSLPSFTWVKAYSGTSTHGRRGHKCVKAYPDQMFVLGGIFTDPSQCVEGGGIIQVFNLNTLKFQDSYSPKVWSQYEVPALVTAKVGGGADGGATASPSSWGDNAIKTLFDTPYNKNITTWYPYSTASSPTTSTSITAKNGGGGGGLPKWVGPVIGVILGLILITGLVLVWLLWHRRDKHMDAETGTSYQRKRIMGWMYGVPKASDMTETSTAIGINEKDGAFSDVVNADMTSTHPLEMAEAHSSPVHEMQGATIIMELPTEFNVSPSSPQQRRVSDSSPLASPISPDVPSAPNADLRPSHPTHARNNSSVSSGPFSLNEAMAGSDGGSPRPHYVSGFREHLVSPDEEEDDRSFGDSSQNPR